jgi:hypothetical protein
LSAQRRNPSPNHHAPPTYESHNAPAPTQSPDPHPPGFFSSESYL